MRSCERCHTPYKTRVEYCGLDGAPVIESDHDPLVGSSFDRYRVTERLGGGGMAVVYRARHDVIEREVAIKILFGELAADKEFAERFRREANAASRIKHPNVVEIFDFGETREGMSFLVMELLKGETLNEAIQWTGPFRPRRAAGVLRQLASGLQAAHDMGYIHRDLKPGNVMLGSGPPGGPVELAKILDFGLVLVASDEATRLTRTGQTLGTPHYMAPEQFAGGEATVRSDLYSLGAVLHEMLAGHAPFRGSLGEVLVQQQSAQPPPLPKSGGLEKLAARLLEKQAKKRPASATEVIELIDGLGLGEVRPEDIPARPETLDLDLHQVLEVKGVGLSPLGAAKEASAVEPDDAPVEVAKAELVPARPLAAVALANEVAPDAGHPPHAADDASGRAPGTVPSPAPPTEDLRELREAAAQARVAADSRGGRVVVVLALLGGLALSGVLFLEAGPLPEFLALAGDATTARASAAVGMDGAHEDTVPYVRQALDRRGLTLADADDMPTLAPKVAAWRQAADQGPSGAATAAAGRLIVEVERARIDAALLHEKLRRLSASVAKKPPAARASLQPKVAALQQEVTDDLSEAECSRLALRISALELEADRE